MQTDTHQVLADPTQRKLRADLCCCVIAQQCFVEAHKGQLEGEAKTNPSARGRNDKIPPQAFSFYTEVRHVLVEHGIRIVGKAAWRSCRQLQGSSRLSASDTANSALDVAAKSPRPIQEQSNRASGEMSPQAAVVRPPAQLGVHTSQVLTDQDLINGHDAPHARLSRKLITRAGTVRTLACDI